MNFAGKQYTCDGVCRINVVPGETFDIDYSIKESVYFALKNATLVVYPK